jgi:hypothetical protein
MTATQPVKSVEQQSMLEDGANEMNALARRVVEHARAQWRELDAHIAWCDERIAKHAKDNAAVRQAAQLMGIGPVTADPVPCQTTFSLQRSTGSSSLRLKLFFR